MPKNQDVKRNQTYFIHMLVVVKVTGSKINILHLEDSQVGERCAWLLQFCVIHCYTSLLPLQMKRTKPKTQTWNFHQNSIRSKRGETGISFKLVLTFTGHIADFFTKQNTELLEISLLLKNQLLKSCFECL